MKKEASVMDARLQLEAVTCTESVDFKFKADTWADGITEQVEYDTREALSLYPALWADRSENRQAGTDLGNRRSALF